MAFDDADAAAASFRESNCTITSSSFNSASGATPTSSTTGNNPPIQSSSSSSSALTESLSDLGRANESLLQTMRLDVEFLGSREDEMRAVLAQLEGQWEMLERLLEEQRKTEELEESAATAAADNSRQKGDNPKVKDKSHQCTSNIDWHCDGDATAAADDDDDEVEKKKEKNEDVSFRAEKEIAIRKEQFASQLKHSNFDWGKDGDSEEVGEAARREAEMGQQQQQALQNDVPILRRIFQPRNRPGGNDGGIFSSVCSANSGERSAKSAPVIGKNNQEKRGWWDIRKGRDDDDRSVATTTCPSNKTNNQFNKRGWWDRNGNIETDKMLDDRSVSTFGSSVNEKPAPFQLFGGRRRMQLNDTQNAINEEGVVNDDTPGNDVDYYSNNTSNLDKIPQQSAENPFQRMFLRRNSRDWSNSTNTRETAETQQSPSYSSDNSSSHQVAATTTKDNNCKQISSTTTRDSTTEDDERVTSALRVKLRGCDSAASTLEQLLSYQTRNLLNLQHERESLRSTLRFESRCSARELEKLRNQLHFAKVERRRKSRFAEDAQKMTKRTQRQEELIKGELESIHMELFLLNISNERMSRVDYCRGGAEMGNITTTNDDDSVSNLLVDSDHRNGSTSHDRVVIVGGGREKTTTTEWRMMGGYHHHQQAAARQIISLGTPNAAHPAG